MKVVGIYRLVLRYGFVLGLERTFYVPFFLENLFQFQDLYSMVLGFNFVGTFLHLLKDNVVVGNDSLDDGLFRLYLNPSHYYSLTTMCDNIGIKRSIINEKSSIF